MDATNCRYALASLVAAIAAGVLMCPTAAESAEGFLEMHVEPALVVDVPEAALKGKLLWKIVASPRPAVVADEPFKSQLQGEVDAALAAAHPWITERSGWSLLSWLTRADGPLAGSKLLFPRGARLDEPNGKPLNHLGFPASGQGPAHIFIPFTYELTPMSRLRIAASSVADPQPTGLAVKQVPLPADLLDTVPAQDRQAVASSVAFELRAKGAAFAPGEEARLLKVARHAFEIVRKQNVLPPRPVVDNRSRDLIENMVRGLLIPHPEPAKSAVLLQPVAGDPGLWRLAVTNIVPIERVKVEARYELANVLAPGTTLSDHAKARLDERASEVAEDLEKRFARDFDGQRGTVLTQTEVDAAIDHLRKDGADRIAKVDNPRVEGGVLTYPIVIKPTVKTLVGSVGVGYTPREGLTGSAGLTAHNLLGWNDDGSFDLKGGPDNRRADVNYGIPLPSDWLKDDRISGRLSLRGLYARTAGTVLGQPRNAAVTEEEHGVFLRQSFMFLPKSWGLSERTALGLEVEFGRRDVDLRGVAAPDSVPVDGVTAPLSLTFRGSTGFEPRDKTGERVRGVDLASSRRSSGRSPSWAPTSDTSGGTSGGRSTGRSGCSAGLRATTCCSATCTDTGRPPPAPHSSVSCASGASRTFAAWRRVSSSAAGSNTSSWRWGWDCARSSSSCSPRPRAPVPPRRPPRQETSARWAASTSAARFSRRSSTTPTSPSARWAGNSSEAPAGSSAPGSRWSFTICPWATRSSA